MADGASIAAVTGLTGVLVAAVGYLNTRRQTSVTLATVQRQVDADKDRLAAEVNREIADRKEKHREARVEAYRHYLEVNFEFMAMAQGVEPLTRDTWREWRQRDSGASSVLDLVCSDAVYAAVDSFDTACVGVCAGCLTSSVWDVDGFKAAYAASTDIGPAFDAVISAMRAETAPK